MDPNQQQNTQAAQQPVQPAAESMSQPPVQPSAPAPLPPSVGPMGGVPQMQAPQQMPPQTPQTPSAPPKRKFKLPKSLVFGLGILFVVILLLVLVLSTLGGRLPDIPLISNGDSESTPTPTPTNTEPTSLSPYANDPEVLSIEEDVNELNQKIFETDLREDTLRIPNVDWNVNFKK